MAKADDLLEELRELTSPFAGAGPEDPLHKIARKFVALDIEILSNRPPAGWSLSKFSKSERRYDDDDSNGSLAHWND